MTVAAPPIESVPREIVRDRRVAGVDAEELARRFGTPLYVYDLDVATRQVEALRAVLPDAFDIAYAVKANPALGVVAHLAALGVGADVASSGELTTALRAGVPASRVVFTGPGKRDDELRHAVDAGVRAVTVESPSELRRLEAIAATAGARVPVLLRAAVSTADRERVRLIGDGGAGKFGMDVDDLRASARRAARSPHLELLGTHAFGASNVLDAQHIAEHVASTIGMARELADDINVPLRLVDVGGGLGIPYEPDQHPLDLVELGAPLTTLTPQLDANAGVRVLIEPGRFLLGPAGAYLCRVVDCKTVNSNAIAVLDGGIHHLLRPALVGQAHRVRRLGTSPATGDAVPATLVGPLCTGLDILAPNAPVGPLQPGDLVAVLDVGAYGFTESMPFFLSHPIPAEVAIRGGEVALLRPRVEPSTWLDRERIPQWSAR